MPRYSHRADSSLPVMYLRGRGRQHAVVIAAQREFRLRARAALPRIMLDPTVENPRWTLCRAALNRELLPWEFMLWVTARSLAFARHHSTTNFDRVRFKFGPREADVLFNTWLEEGVKAGKWREVPP